MSSPAWGKFDRTTGETHHLAHHCADVAACFNALLTQPMFRAHAEAALENVLTDDQITGLTALAFLHDLGKVAPAFQAIAWPHAKDTVGHLICGLYWEDMADEICLGGLVSDLSAWPNMEMWMQDVFAHHDRPLSEPMNGKATAAFTDRIGYNGAMLMRYLANLCAVGSPALPTSVPSGQACFCPRYLRPAKSCGLGRL
ncbi:MAG: hypothetical protein HWE26_22845 [Alteromonadaceae bacterium]|nr:hypothetical protein [Alteromonadaceae bacterium]